MIEVARSANWLRVPSDRSEISGFQRIMVSTVTFGVATATEPYSGHLPLKPSTSSVPCGIETPVSSILSSIESNTVTPG